MFTLIFYLYTSVQVYSAGVVVCLSTCRVPHLENYNGQFLSMLCMLTSVAGNQQGLPNSIRPKDQIENARIDRYSPFFHNLVGYSSLGFDKLAYVVNMHCRSTTNEMCLLDFSQSNCFNLQRQLLWISEGNFPTRVIINKNKAHTLCTYS